MNTDGVYGKKREKKKNRTIKTKRKKKRKERRSAETAGARAGVARSLPDLWISLLLAVVGYTG